MEVICLHAQQEIEQVLRRNTFLHLYALGDLDDFFWRYTTWYALEQQVEQVVLLYSEPTLPVLLATAEEPSVSLDVLLRGMLHLLPRRFYAHLTRSAAGAIASAYRMQSYGVHYKMALLDTSPLVTVDTTSAVQLLVSDLPEVEEFYSVSYPGNWFDPRMLETGHYYGIRCNGRLVSIAGVHVYSARYRVATLGNVVTHPAARGQGMATVVCAKLCQELLRTVEHIGLNVRADNASAIACYKRLGFESIATYEEFECEAKNFNK